MNSKRVVFCAVAAASMGLAACGSGHRGAAAPVVTPPAGSQSLDTAQVLSLAQQSSETAAPIAVNNGAVSLNDSSETTTPLAVNAM
jgi:hypothetical protein